MKALRAALRGCRAARRGGRAAVDRRSRTFRSRPTQQRRLAAAWREGADAVREVEIAIAQENAVRRIGLDIKSAEGQAVAQSIKLSADAQATTDAETAAIAASQLLSCRRCWPGRSARLSTEDIRRDPAQSRQSQQQAEETAASWQVATQAAGVHFRTVDDFGVAAGQGIGELTTSVVLYGESFEDVGKSILRSLIETTAQILITTAAVTAMRAAFSRQSAWPAAGSLVVLPPDPPRRARKGSPASWASAPWPQLHLLPPPLLRPAVPCSRRCRAVRELRAAAWSA